MFEDINYEIRPLRLKNTHSASGEKAGELCVCVRLSPCVCVEKRNTLSKSIGNSLFKHPQAQSQQKVVKRNRIESLDPFHCF